MVLVTVLYPASDGAKFDFDYYLAKHIPLVEQCWSEAGMEKIEVVRGTPGPGGEAPAFVAMALITFRSREAFETALADHAPKIMGDVPSYTDIKPILQINEPAA